MSKCLERLVKLKGWSDSFRILHPTSLKYSRFYENTRAEGASRIDRCYQFGNLVVKQAIYVPVAFSDHMAHVVEFLVPDNYAQMIMPKCWPSFRVKAEVIRNNVFKERLADAMEMWERVRMLHCSESQASESDIFSW